MKAEVYLRSGNIINLDNVTHQEKNDLECGLDTQTNYNHRIYVGEWVFDGRSVDAVRFIEEEAERKQYTYSMLCCQTMDGKGCTSRKFWIS